MKNIFIGGVAKSGKTRLALELCNKYRMNHIPMDYFTSSFKHNFKEIGITSNVLIEEKTSKLLSTFLSRFIEIAENQNDELFIIDSAHIYPKDIIKYLNPEKWEIYYIGYSKTTPQDKLQELKKYINNGWIITKTDEELIELLEGLIKISREIEKECIKNNIKYIDTSKDDIIDIFNSERK